MTRGDSSRRPGSGGLRRRLLVALAASVVSLALAELLVRAALPPPQRLSYRRPDHDAAEPTRVRSHAGEGGLYVLTEGGRRLRPDMHVIVENHALSGRRVEIRTNELGYRSPPIGPKGPRPRVLFLGDSVTWGDWLPEEHTFVRRIEALSEQAAEPIETINAAIGAISITEELAILEETGLGVEPDVVVLCFYLNDAQPSRLSRPPRAPSWLAFSHLAAHVWRLLPAKAAAGGEAARAADEFAAVVRREVAAAYPGGEGDPTSDPRAFHREIAAAARDWGAAWSPTAQGVIRRDLTAMARLAEEHGFDLRVVMFPVLLQVQAELVQDHPQRWMRELCAELELPMLDLLPALRSAYRRAPGTLFQDHCHHTAEGNALVAEEIWRFLRGA